MKKNYLILFLNLVCGFAFAQMPYMVKDIDTLIATGNGFANFTDLNSTVIMTGTDSLHGTELWRSDGTPQGTYILKDIISGPAGSSPYMLLKFNNAILFFIQKPLGDYELWKTDGTLQGTVLVKNNFITNNPYNNYYSTPQDFMATKTTAFFMFTDAAGNQELWKTDGTTSGTSQVTTLPYSDYPSNFNTTDSYLFYTLSQSGLNLYRTDGTTAGTIQLASSIYYSPIIKTNNYIYYWQNSYDLYKTDGTVAGTSLVKTGIYPANSGYTFIGNTIFFAASDSASAVNYNYDFELWKSDGTAAGTGEVKNINPSGPSTPGSFYSAGNTVYFYANDGYNGYSLFKTDGTPAGTDFIKHIQLGIGTSNGKNYTMLNGKVYFNDSDSAHGNEVWVTDGTTNGTQLLKDINPGKPDGFNTGFITSGSKIFFTAINAPGAMPALYATDGTAAETNLVMQTERIDQGGTFSNLATLSSGICFFENNDLYKSDGTAAGTIKLKSFSTLIPGIRNSGSLTLTNNLAYFIFYTNSNTYLWRTDGTVAGTIQIYETSTHVRCGHGCSYTPLIGQVFYAGGTTYFTVQNTALTQTSLLKTDGTAQGISSLETFTSIGQLADVNGRLYFNGGDPTYGTELYTSDGTAAGTVLVKDIYPGYNSSSPYSFTNVNDTLYFIATDASGTGLWWAAGNSIGSFSTQAFPGGFNILSAGKKGTSQFYLTVYGTNSSLWVCNGKSSGAQEITSSGNALMPTYNMASVMNGKLYISGSTTTTNINDELWSTDGTSQGTSEVFSLVVEANYSSNPSIQLALDSVFFMTADNGYNGSELWISNGTQQGTSMVADIYPGPQPSGIANMIYYKGAVYFTANDGVHGTELWRYNVPYSYTPNYPDSSYITTGIIPSVNTDIVIYPNPGSGLYTVRFADKAPAILAVYNSLGALIKTIPVDNTAATTIDVSACPAGMYMVCSPEGDIKVSQKIVKQ